MKTTYSMHYSGTYSNGVQFSDVSDAVATTKAKCIAAAKDMQADHNLRMLHGPDGVRVSQLSCYVVEDATNSMVWG